VSFSRYSSAAKGLMELEIQRRDMRATGGIEIFGRGDVMITCGLNWLPQTGNMPRLYAMQSLVGLRLITMCYDIIPIKFTHIVPGMDVVFRAVHAGDWFGMPTMSSAFPVAPGATCCAGANRKASGLWKRASCRWAANCQPRLEKMSASV